MSELIYKYNLGDHGNREWRALSHVDHVVRVLSVQADPDGYRYLCAWCEVVPGAWPAVLAAAKEDKHAVLAQAEIMLVSTGGEPPPVVPWWSTAFLANPRFLGTAVVPPASCSTCTPASAACRLVAHGRARAHIPHGDRR